MGILAPPLPGRNPDNPPGASSRPSPPAAARSRRLRLPQHAAAACRSGPRQGVARQCAAWTCSSGWGKLRPFRSAAPAPACRSGAQQGVARAGHAA
jgi:hypothetical protein